MSELDIKVAPSLDIKLQLMLIHVSDVFLMSTFDNTFAPSSHIELQPILSSFNGINNIKCYK